MEQMMTQALAGAYEEFRLPRTNELPDMGLYLEQTVQYINQILKPMGCIEVTGSMVRNYVKMGLVRRPIRKQYHSDQISHLICITVLKTVLPLEHIGKLFLRQESIYTDEIAYDYFCMELENVLNYRFGLREYVPNLGETHSIEKTMLHSAIVAVSHIIFVNACFDLLESGNAAVPPAPESTAE